MEEEEGGGGQGESEPDGVCRLEAAWITAA